MDLPAIAIEPTAENDLVLVLDALFSTRDAALMVSRPRTLLSTYRAEFALLRDMVLDDDENVLEVPAGLDAVEEPVLDGSILR